MFATVIGLSTDILVVIAINIQNVRVLCIIYENRSCVLRSSDFMNFTFVLNFINTTEEEDKAQRSTEKV